MILLVNLDLFSPWKRIGTSWCVFCGERKSKPLRWTVEMELVLRLLKSVSQKSACYSYCFYLLILFCISWYIDLLPCLHLYLFVCLFMSSLYLFFRSFIHPFIHLLIWLFVSLFVKSLWLLVVIGYPMCSVVSSLCLPTYLLMSLYTLMYVCCCKLLIIFHLFTCQFMHRFICLTFLFWKLLTRWPPNLWLTSKNCHVEIRRSHRLKVDVFCHCGKTGCSIVMLTRG